MRTKRRRRRSEWSRWCSTGTRWSPSSSLRSLGSGVASNWAAGAPCLRMCAHFLKPIPVCASVSMPTDISTGCCPR
uniref:Uncharacterized protein n=1 Tax=Arundo donax TaxID=35708 RepID=A0A0A8Z399_ARUDO